MSVQHPHTKLLNAAAREVLGPLGLAQKGRSRTWLDDRGWWLGVVEFQPSSWSRGSYLNVGVNWLWEPKTHLSFDFGVPGSVSGQGQFVQYLDDEQFTPLARQLATEAAREVDRYRGLFPTVEAAASVLVEAQEGRAPSFLQAIDAGIALGLAGNAVAARRMFARFLAICRAPGVEPSDSQVARCERVRLLDRLVSDRAEFAVHVLRAVSVGRKLLKLGPWEPAEDLGLPTESV